VQTDLLKGRTNLLQIINLKVIQDESLKSSDRNLEHKRRLVLEILRQRKILTDSETGVLINDNTDIRTLLKIIQREKEEEKDKETVKIKALPEASFITDRFTGTNPLMYYTIPYNLWYRGYCSARDLITELTMMLLLLLAINPHTAWFFHPFLFGWTQ
jgi:hypothetical protein